MLSRLPIESAQPVLVFAAVRVAIVVVSLVAIVVLGFPYEGEAVIALAGILLPWSLLQLALAERNTALSLNPLMAAGDIVALAVLELVVPELYGAVRAAALFLLAVHAHFQGVRRGLALGGFGSLLLVAAAALRGDAPIGGDTLILYEIAFLISALATGLVVGRLRTTESASRLRARSLSRRTIQAESEVRRRVAESIHDGPVQELIALDMILSTARQAASDGDRDRAGKLIDDARELAGRNIRALREEIVDLGPYAFEELSFSTAIENCMPVWKRRYGFEVMAAIEAIDLPPDMAGDLFRIAQEAVINAGRHAHAEAVSISLRTVGGNVELRVTDNGRGFGEIDPLGPSEAGHLGLASMRERAELLEGKLDIESSALGTRVLVLVPLRQPVG
jgi:two-component system NarL family sensor kinase